MGASHEFGRAGEGLAAAELERRGWMIVDRNFRFGHREIDLVVRRGNIVAFVEVKARKGPGYGDPLEAITARKRRELLAAARLWQSRFGQASDIYRFDAVAIRSGKSGLEVEHSEDAWRL